MASSNKNKYKLGQYIMAVYSTCENMKKTLRSMASEPDTILEDNMKDFANTMKLPDSKYGCISMLLAGEYSFLISSDNRV